MAENPELVCAMTSDEAELADCPHGIDQTDSIPSKESALSMVPSKLTGFEFWHQTLNSAKYILAPMVDASELAWRLLSRRYGAQLCYTPMLHANVFVKDARYRHDNLQSCAEDRPLIVQFCANDPEIFCKAAKLAAPYCDAIDLNLGCPQAIAKRGNYGAFLQDDWGLIFSMVKECHENVSVPITVKIRVFDDVDKTVKYAKMIERAGCQLLTVHGRTREMKGMNTGLASWSVIKTVRENLKIPVFANGNIQFLQDADKCIEETGVVGVMSAEGNLHNPAIFKGIDPPIWLMAEEYMDLVRKYPCPLSYARGHLFKLFQHFLPRNTDIRSELSSVHDFDSMTKVVEKVKERCMEEEKKNENPFSSGLVDNLKLPFWICQPYERPKIKDSDSKSSEKKRSAEEVIVDGVKLSRNRLKKLKRNPRKRFETRPMEYSLCSTCQNPRGLKCDHELCRACCRKKSYHEKLDCVGHNYKFLTKMQQSKNASVDACNNTK